jgi:glycosyltransferase involved in cell wall biosynthesis
LIDWDVVVISLPYLIDEALRTSARVRIVQNASYQELKELYARCSAAVVPIRAGATYMAGIRAAMEGLLLRAPVLATRIPCLEEYFQDDVDLLFFTAEDANSLAHVAMRLGAEPQLRERLCANAGSTM